jgi:hypothetical protein
LFELIKPTNLDIEDAACLHVVHFLQHPTSRPTTRSTQHTIVNALKTNLSPHPTGKYGGSTEHSAQGSQQANRGNGAFEADRLRTLGALHSVQSKKKLSAENRRETYFVSNEEREKWIEDYVKQETTVGRKRVQDAETAMKQEQEHMGNGHTQNLK